MDSTQFETLLQEALEECRRFAFAGELGDITTFEEVGMLCSNRGLVVRCGDSEFQIQIVQSK